jgi:hypothetical protein
VLRGLCRFESLKDGTLGLEDLALMNDAIDVQADNQRLAQERSEAKRN